MKKMFFLVLLVFMILVSTESHSWLWEGSINCGVYSYTCDSEGYGGVHFFRGSRSTSECGYPDWRFHPNCRGRTICNDQLRYSCIPGCGCPPPCTPQNCQWSNWQNDPNSYDSNLGIYMRQTRSIAQSASCGGSSCSGSDQQCRYYKDADGDGYGDPLGSVSGWHSCTGPPQGYARNNLDCFDDPLDNVEHDVCWPNGSGGFIPESQRALSLYNSEVRNRIDCNNPSFAVCAKCRNPGVVEQGFEICTDEIDNSCRDYLASRNLGTSGYDYNNPLCQITCPDDYTELLRHSSNVLGNSLVTADVDPNSLSRFQYYFPLCVRGDNLDTSCSADAAIPILKVNPITNTVVSNASNDPSFSQDICMNAVDCYVAETCDDSLTHNAIASLGGNGDLGTTLVHPNITGDYQLCCSADRFGIRYDNSPLGEPPLYEETTFTCSVISDGICPEDFEDANGNRISCAAYADPDCGWATKFYRSNIERIRGLFVSFPERSYVMEAVNNQNALVMVNDETVTGNELTYEFTITSEIRSSLSRTDILFSTGSEPDVSFDEESVVECDGIPSEESTLPCYHWNNRRLTLYHTLSTHNVSVTFTYWNVSFFLILLLLFAIIIPIVAIRKSHVVLRWPEKKPKESVVEHIQQLAKGEKELEEYIRKALDKGYPKSKIYGALLNAGWDKEEIDFIFKRIK
ncbi:MAG: hypothetical protein ACMXYK_03935 [Candidatus Woesearchaeota archaeon]